MACLLAPVAKMDAFRFFVAGVRFFAGVRPLPDPAVADPLRLGPAEPLLAAARRAAFNSAADSLCKSPSWSSASSAKWAGLVSSINSTSASVEYLRKALFAVYSKRQWTGRHPLAQR